MRPRPRSRRVLPGPVLGQLGADAIGVAVEDREALFYRLTSRGLVDRRVEVADGVGSAVLGVQLLSGDAVDEERSDDFGAIVAEAKYVYLASRVNASGAGGLPHSAPIILAALALTVVDSRCERLVETAFHVAWFRRAGFWLNKNARPASLADCSNNAGRFGPS